MDFIIRSAIAQEVNSVQHYPGRSGPHNLLRSRTQQDRLRIAHSAQAPTPGWGTKGSRVRRVRSNCDLMIKTGSGTSDARPITPCDGTSLRNGALCRSQLAPALPAQHLHEHPARHQSPGRLTNGLATRRGHCRTGHAPQLAQSPSDQRSLSKTVPGVGASS